MLTRKDIMQVTEVLLELRAKKVVKFVRDNFVVKVSRRHKPRKDDRHTELLFSFGRPNYDERQRIKLYKKAKVRFPVSKLYIKSY